MTGQDWPVGTVATATVRGIEGVRAIRCGGVGTSGREQVPFWWTAEYVIEWRTHTDEDVTDARPLVVLDLDDPAILIEALRRNHFLWLADQIEGQTKPPRIPEPGLWGVVSTQTVDGLTDYWTHGHAGWFSQENGETWQWADLIDPVLVRPGIEEDS